MSIPQSAKQVLKEGEREMGTVPVQRGHTRILTYLLTLSALSVKRFIPPLSEGLHKGQAGELLLPELCASVLP